MDVPAVQMPPSLTPRRDLWCLALALGLFFIFLEVLKAHRGALWSGDAPGDWAGVAVGLGFYVIVLGLLAEGSRVAFGWLTRGPVPHAVAASRCVVAAGVMVWGVLSAYREYSPTLDDVLVGAALMGLASAATLLPRWGWMSLRAVSGAVSVVLISGIGCVAAAAQCFLFEPNRAELVTKTAMVWLAVCAVAALFLWTAPSKALGNVRRFVFLLAAVGAPLAALYFPPVREVPGERTGPNLVLIVVDTLRADLCSVYGGPCATPSLDGLARDGVRFDRCYSLGPWTPPAMLGMFASTYPPGLTPGVPRTTWLDEIWRYILRPEDGVLSETLAEKRYATGALIANPMLRGMEGMLRGFETTAFSHPTVMSRGGLFARLPFLQDTLAAWFPRLAPERFHDTTADMTRYARQYLCRNRDRSFFLWVHYMDPHAPYDPPDAYRTMSGPFRAFSPDIGGTPEGSDYKPLADFQPDDRPYVRSLYEGEVRYVDHSIGEILAEIRRLGLANTYVCVTADHGEELWDHGGWGHGQNLYEELVHVPLLLNGPGLAHRTIPEPVTILDLMPTLADLLSVPPAPSWQGESLAPVIRGERPADPERACFARGTSQRVQREPLEMVVQEDYKLIEGRPSGDKTLFNVRQDPAETRDLAGEALDQVKRQADLLEEWRTRYPADLWEFLGDESASGDRQERMQQLRAVGYLN